MESIYSLAVRERKISEGRSLSLEDITKREERGAVRREERVAVRREERVKSKDQRERKLQVMDAKGLGVKIHVAETTSFPEKITFEEIVEGIKTGKYKITYVEKKTESDITAMLVKMRIRITQEELKIVPDDVFRKMRQRREHTLPSKPIKKAWQK